MTRAANTSLSSPALWETALPTSIPVVVDLIAGIKAVRALELRITNQDQLFSMHRRRLVSSFGLFTALP